VDLSVRIDPRSVPDELVAPIHKLDDLLARLEASFDWGRSRRCRSMTRSMLGATWPAMKPTRGLETPRIREDLRT
jgi:hypothetical protein